MIKYLFTEQLVVSAILLAACLIIKQKTGKIEKWKLRTEAPKLFDAIKFSVDIVIDIIPVLAYHLISLIENNTSKTMVCTVIMIGFIFLEAIIRNSILCLSGDKIKPLLLLMFLLIVLSFVLYLSIYYIATTHFFNR